MVRKAIESTYIGKCTIVEHQKIIRENKSTGFIDNEVLTDQPCKLSFKSITSNSQSETAAYMTQTTKLFIAPEIKIIPGSKITVTQNGMTKEYKNSGEPAMYSTHQEIILELFDGWS